MHQFLHDRARFLGLVLALCALTTAGLALPASAERSAGTGSTGPSAGSTSVDPDVQLGPATKYVRDDDGTVHQIR